MLYRNSCEFVPDETDLFEELAGRLRSGERNVAHSIIDSIAGQNTDTEFVIDLIYREYLVLRQLGETPEISIFCRRFPRYEQRLRRLLEVDQELADDTGTHSAHTVADRFLPDETIEAKPVPSRVIGRYQLIHQIGHGGSSRVFKARQTGLDRIVAIKLLSTNVFDLQLEKRFRQEAELIARAASFSWKSFELPFETTGSAHRETGGDSLLPLSHIKQGPKP